MADARIFAPLVIPKSKLQFRMTELCIQDELCHFDLTTFGTYNNYVCMGDEADEARMNCRMLRIDERESTPRVELSFRCKSDLFENTSDAKSEPSREIHSCYYVGDNTIQAKDAEHDSVTDTLACIRQKHACKLPYKVAIGKCDDVACISEVRTRMKKECPYRCSG